MTAFACRRCGTCCRWPGAVLLTAADAAVAAEFLGIGVGEFVAAYTVLARNRAQLALQEAPDGACVFLAADRRCRIYAARPRQCRDFPNGWRVDGCPAAAAPGT